MSNNGTQVEDTAGNFESRVESVYQQYRHSQLADRLDDIADTMEETILQKVLAERFLQTELEIDEEAKEAVAQGHDLLEKEDFESLGEHIGTLENLVEEQQRRVTNEIHETRITMASRVRGMQRLNERVERVSPVKLTAIYELLSDWDWRGQVYREEDYGFETLKERAAEYGEDMRQYFEECREDIFEPYADTPLEPIVDGLLSDDRLPLADLSDEQMRQLRDSDLSTHVGLSLS